MASRLQALLAGTSDVVLVFQPAGRVTWAGGASLGGHPPEFLGDRRALGLIDAGDRAALFTFLQQAAQEPSVPPIRLRLQAVDGSWRHVTVRAVNRLQDPWIRGVVLTVTDHTDLQETLDGATRSARRLSRLVNQAADALLVCDPDGRLRFASDPAVELLGPSASREVLLSDLVAPEDASAVSAALAAALASPSRGRATGSPVEFRGRHLDPQGRPPHLEATFTNLVGDPDVAGIAVTLHDVTERRRAADDWAHRALHDPLTGLPNRTLFMDRLEHSISRLSREPGSVAVLFADVDHFKAVNDRFGHGAGDRVLRDLSEHLRSLIRPGDTVARFGGDEFVLLCEGATLERASAIAERINDLPITLAPKDTGDEAEPSVSFSVGLAATSDPSTSPAQLLADADAAMYRAKAAGRARLVAQGSGEGPRPGSSGSDPDAGERRLDPAAEPELPLRRALDGRELRLHYQPVVRLADGRVMGAEALLRWEQPLRGLVGPNEFMEAAEQTGLIVPIGAWVITTACRQAVAWGQALNTTPLMSVNVSARQLASADFVDCVRRDLEESGLPGTRLGLEVTERALLADADHCAAVLGELKDLGLTISVDDYGLGQSMLAPLRRFPLDAIKVDRSLIGGLGTDPEVMATVTAIVRQASRLGLATVAEGVETSDQAEALSLMGCVLAQGYRFGRPQPAEELAAILA